MKVEEESLEIRIQKAQYYMSTANTLVLTGTIFILGFLSSLTMTSSEYEALRLIMLGLLPLGLIALYDGIASYFRAQKLMRMSKPAHLPSYRSGIDVITAVLLICVFLIVNWMMYGTWMLNPMTVLALCLATALIGWIKLSVER